MTDEQRSGPRNGTGRRREVKPFGALALGCAALLLVAACGDTIVTKKKIGEACTDGSQCASTGECKGGVCTKVCTGQLDCPVGFDCTLAAAGDTDATCVKQSYDPKLAGGFGTDCSAFAQDPSSMTSCGGANPCASGFTCSAFLKCDPAAYCTKTCTTDGDCPATMFCGTLRSGTLKAQQSCIKRSYCSSCGVDDQCTGGFNACAKDAKGERFCSKTCNTNSDCPQPMGGDFFEKCLPDANGRKVCQNVDANKNAFFCHGPSVLAGIMGSGAVCSPCRLGVPGDCAMGAVCFQDEFSTERFCTVSCTAKLVAAGQGYNIASDDCAMGSYCYFGGVPQSCGNGCNVQGLCAADPAYMTLTCHP